MNIQDLSNHKIDCIIIESEKLLKHLPYGLHVPSGSTTYHLTGIIQNCLHELKNEREKRVRQELERQRQATYILHNYHEDTQETFTGKTIDEIKVIAESKWDIKQWQWMCGFLDWSKLSDDRQIEIVEHKDES